MTLASVKSHHHRWCSGARNKPGWTWTNLIFLYAHIPGERESESERKGKGMAGMVCEQKDSTMALTSISDGVPALLPCTDFLPGPGAQTSHAGARTLRPVGKYTVRPDCTSISTTRRVVSPLCSAGKLMRLLTRHFWTQCEFVYFVLFIVLWKKVLCAINRYMPV